MFYDTRKINDGALIDTTVCVVGAGAAGITMGIALARAGVSVAICESGGLELDPDIQALYQGDSLKGEYHEMDRSRLRYFGGTTNHWTGWTRPLDAIDFERRGWVPHSGWPISFEDLRGYYKKAEKLVQIGEHSFEPAYWEELTGQRFFSTREGLETGIVRHSPPTRFGNRYRGFFHRSTRAHVYLFANLVNLELNASGDKVSVARFSTLSGASFGVRATWFVLATGGIENARLLLSFNDGHENGVGNQHDMVGRFFADHKGTVLGICTLMEQKERLESYGSRTVRSVETAQVAAITAGLRLSDQELVNRQLANFGVAITRFHPDEEFNPHVLQRSGPPEYLKMIASVEPFPDPESRVMLSEERDPLGLFRPVLDYRIARKQHEMVRSIAGEFILEWARSGLGRGRIDEGHEPPEGMPGYGDHHMGTTRMHDSPKKGVVDRHCRIHGMKNLYIAGSSVFPTFGYAQPTLTIVALALRLAERLARNVNGAP